MNEPRSIPSNHGIPRLTPPHEVEWRLHAQACKARLEAEREAESALNDLRDDLRKAFSVLREIVYVHEPTVDKSNAMRYHRAEREMRRLNEKYGWLLNK